MKWSVLVVLIHESESISIGRVLKLAFQALFSQPAYQVWSVFAVLLLCNYFQHFYHRPTPASQWVANQDLLLWRLLSLQLHRCHSLFSILLRMNDLTLWNFFLDGFSFFLHILIPSAYLSFFLYFLQRRALRRSRVRMIFSTGWLYRVRREDDIWSRFIFLRMLSWKVIFVGRRVLIFLTMRRRERMRWLAEESNWAH